MLALLLGLLPATTPQNDVLVILLDDVGKDLLAVYDGPDPAYTPNIDMLASEGRVYDRAYANPLCAPSRACLATGRYSFRTGIGATPGPFAPFTLDPAEQCIPEFIAPGENIAFQYFSKWHLVHSDGIDDTDRHPYDACFYERFFGHMGNIGSESSLPGTDHYFWRAVDLTEEGPEVSILNAYAADNFTETFWSTSICKDQLVQRLNGLDPTRRAVTIWAPVAPHAPFQAPPVTLVSAETAASLPPPPAIAPVGQERPYALAMLEALDSVIGEALDEIAEDRLAQTTIILMGDNGTSQRVVHPTLDPDHAKTTLYELGIGVPLIVVGPTVESRGSRDDALVHIVDVPATIYDLMGSGSYAGGEDSVSFYNTFVFNAPGLRSTVFAERFDPNGMSPDASIRAVVGPRYKLIVSEGTEQDGEELYDLELDPDETNNLLLDQLTSAEREGYRTLRIELRRLLERSDSFCDGADGSLAACPCGNAGNADSGCDLQQSTGGVRLEFEAQQTSPLNRATMLGSGFPSTSTPASIVIRAPHLDDAAPVVFGDGLRCVGLPLARISATIASGGVSTHTFGHGSMAGVGTTFYQLWFRNVPVMFCDPAAAFNLSNGRVLVW